MCGLVGCAGASLEAKHERAFRELLIVDTIRGPHSTGIMAANNSGDVEVFKKALLPSDMFTMSGCQQLFKKINHALIGHNRWATQGKINGINAHPFEFETLVGAHNGTLVNQRLLPDYTKFEVDSENIFHSIEKIGLKDTVASLNGAYALTWYDKEQRSMNIIRNKERPMFVTFTKDERVMFWSSESWMLFGVLAKNDIEHGEVFDTKVDTHYEFKIPKGVTGKPETFKMPKPIQRAIEPWKAPPLPKQQGNVVNGRFMRNNGADSTKTNGTTSSPSKNDGWEYEMGEDIYFYLDPESPSNTNFIFGLLAHNKSKRVKIFARRKSYLRSNLKCDDVNDILYQGIVNGYFMGGVICQENSVYTVVPDNDYTEDDEDDEDDDHIVAKDTVSEMDRAINAAKIMDPDERHQQVTALNATQGTCSWCGDPITPDNAHVYLNHNTIVCGDCKENDADARETIESYTRAF